LPKRLPVLIALALVLGLGILATAFIWPQAFKAAWNWGGSLLSRRDARPAQAPAAQPPEVGVIGLRLAEVPLPVAYAGRVAGFREVEVRARVGGSILKREFDEGARVAEGHVLFRIDPTTYQVDLARAEAQLAQAQAQARQAEENYNRIEQLASRDVASRQRLDEARAQRDLTRAGVALAQAEIEAAKLNIGYTTVTAPVAGATALESPPEGTLVLAQQTVLTMITQLDPAYVNFSFTTAEYKAFRELNQQRKQPIKSEDLTVELQYGDGSVYPLKGRIDIAEQQVDLQTGTIEARAIFPNPDGAILPGQFVRLAVQGVTLPDVIVIPERAISQGPQGPFVFVIDPSDTAQARLVRLGQEVATGFVIREGLLPGDRVVVDGVIRVRPGAPVNAVPADLARQRHQQASPSKPTAATGDPTEAGGARP